MSSFPFAIVGFDLDGTLLDTAHDIGHALNHALTSVGRPPIPLEQARQYIGAGSAKLMRDALEASGGIEGIDLAELQDVLLGYYAENIARNTVLFPGAEAMLDALASRGVRLAVATNKREDMALRLFDALGLTHRFATIIGGNTLGPGTAKPAPDMLHEMTKRLGGGRAAFVGDTTFDVRAAKAAGLPVIAVRFGFWDLPPDELGADAVIDHFDELLPALERLA